MNDFSKIIKWKKVTQVIYYRKKRQSPHLTLCHNQIQKRLSQQLSIVTFTSALYK